MNPKDYISKLDALAKKQSVFQPKDLSHIALQNPESILKYHDDCDMLEICKELGATYNMCYKDANILSERCSPAEKQSILLQHEQNILQQKIQDREDARQAREEKLQILRDKKAVRRSWVQLVAAAILGGAITKLIDFLPLFIAWLKSLLA